MQEYPDYPIEFYSEAENTDDLFAEAEDRIRRLAGDHTDITGATVKITQPAVRQERPVINEATIILSMRPNDIVASDQHADAAVAIRNALSIVEREVREERARRRNY